MARIDLRDGGDGTGRRAIDFEFIAFVRDAIVSLQRLDAFGGLPLTVCHFTLPHLRRRVSKNGRLMMGYDSRRVILLVSLFRGAALWIVSITRWMIILAAPSFL